MVSLLHESNAKRCSGGTWAVIRWAGVVGVLCGGIAPLAAEDPGVHYRWTDRTPPGAIGSWQLQRGGPLCGFFQPVEIQAPAGAQVSLAAGGKFLPPEPAPVQAGLLIAPVYRLRVTQIPRHEGLEVYPTVEIIDRLYAPPGETRRFPIPIELTLEELELALAGKFVTRVIYLEDPDQALAFTQQGKQQNWFDAGPGANPVQIADGLGRPMAILRMGGRLPTDEEAWAQFFNGCPPWKRYRTRADAVRTAPPVDAVEEAAVMPDRLPLVRSRTRAQRSRQVSVRPMREPLR